MNTIRSLGYLLLNVICSVALVITNKILFSANGFKFPTAVTALHLLLGGAYGYLRRDKSSVVRAEGLPAITIGKLVLLNSSTVVLLNLSLMINSVSFYQISKLAMIPTTGILEYFVISSVYPINKWFFGLIVIGGAGIITVNDFKIDVGYFGIIIAMGAVFCGCSQQIMIRLIQTDNKASISELMASVLPWSGAILSVLAYSIDSQISGLYIHCYKWSTEAAKNLILSSALSIGVNLSQFLCLRELSALEFQVSFVFHGMADPRCSLKADDEFHGFCFMKCRY